MKENNIDEKKEQNERSDKIKKEQSDGDIKINDLSNTKLALTQITCNSGIETIAQKMKALIIPTDLYMKKMNESISSLQETLKKIADIIKPITETVINYQIKMTPYFKELGEALQKARENPDSLMNWIKYCERLEDYLWTFPFDMESEELKNILENVNSEEEFDKYMLKYFDNKKIEKLKDNILKLLPYKHKVIYKQIMNAFYNKDYAISNLGITAIIDDLCTYFLADKGCLKRKDIFLPIIEEVDLNSNNFEAIPLIIVNSNINKIYEKIDFTKRISITTHKKSRRNTNQHGKKFVNSKLDTIMLLNTIYYMLLVSDKFSEYKGKIIYVDNKSKLKMARIVKRKEIPGFYIKKKYYRAKK